MGKASPELLRSDLRRLPGDVYTKDLADPDRVHELDPEHIREALVDEAQKKERGVRTPLELADDAKKIAPVAVQDPREARLTQERVDVVRLRVLAAWAETQLMAIRDGASGDFTVKHLWFHRDSINAYELRSGNPPPDEERPKHLRRLRLELDIASGELPWTIVERLRELASSEAAQ